jgi:phosphatidylserine/phosphatidylglycerophosphate/cardiolipin synthase-like enzyme
MPDLLQSDSAELCAPAGSRASRSGRDLPVFFGGPGEPEHRLRNLLLDRIEAVPPGGTIDWMTYYFRDGLLADALARAKRRGVDVRLCLEGWPRRRHANDRVIRRLGDSKAGLGSGLRIERHLIPSHLHAKIYAFSHPTPYVLVGSFNPSGSEDAADASLTADIGDQDRGHNLLVEVHDPIVVPSLVRHVRKVHAGASLVDLIGGPRRSRTTGEAVTTATFPCLGVNPLDRQLENLGSGAKVRIAASHVRDPLLCGRLGKLARRGVEVQLLTHATLRRTPRRIEKALTSKGVRMFRYAHPDKLPMHCKFLLVQDGARQWSAFGSYNFTLTSRWLNQELLAFTEDQALWAVLDQRWRQIHDEPWTQACPASSAEGAAAG